MASVFGGMGETLGDRLRRLARARGWSDEKAAREAGVSYRQYQRWLAGASDPRGSSLRRVADTFGVPIGELMPGTPSDSQLQRIDGKLGEMLTRLEAIERRLGAQPAPDRSLEALGETVDRLSEEAGSPPPPAPARRQSPPARKRRKNA